MLTCILIYYTNFINYTGIERREGSGPIMHNVTVLIFFIIMHQKEKEGEKEEEGKRKERKTKLD